MVGNSRKKWIVLACAMLLVAGCTQPTPPANETDDEDLGDEPGAGDDGDRRAAALTWRGHEFLGSVLTDRHAMTVYVFMQDEPGESACKGSCAETWSPVTSEDGTFTPSDLEDRVGTLERDDGTRQLTLDDRPLYTYAGDEEPGDANGQGRAGMWYVVRESDPPGQINADVLDGPGSHEVTGGEVSYAPEAAGYLAQPSEEGSYPGIVVIHEWWGLNDNVRRMTDALASHGYSALAVDLFNGSVAETPEQARSQVRALNQSQATANMRAAADHLATQLDAPRVASLGWCFGGGQSLQLAISGEPLDATVLYYGTPLVTNETALDRIEWPVMGVFGDEDQALPVDRVETFEASLTNLSIGHEIHMYEGVGHAFANPSGDAYAPEKSMDAWTKTLDFLEANLEGS